MFYFYIDFFVASKYRFLRLNLLKVNLLKKQSGLLFYFQWKNVHIIKIKNSFYFTIMFYSIFNSFQTDYVGQMILNYRFQTVLLVYVLWLFTFRTHSVYELRTRRQIHTLYQASLVGCTKNCSLGLRNKCWTLL